MTVLLEIKACLFKIYINLTRISRKKGIHLLIVFPPKLVTPLYINDATSTLPRVDQPKLFGRLGRCSPGKTIYRQCGIHH